MVVQIRRGVLGMQVDTRYRQWAKRVRPTDVDLSREGGYALGGQFLRWGEAVALEEGEYLVVASEQGSRANHRYYYALGQVRGGKLVDLTDRVDEALEKLPLTDGQRARALNSELYAYAAYIYYTAQTLQAPPPEPEDPMASIPDEQLIAALQRRGYVVVRAGVAQEAGQ